jgi:GNAT superfamily N-acetyltransferase
MSFKQSNVGTVRICDLEARHEQEWRGLWQRYLEFYEAQLDDNVTANTWRMLLQPETGALGFGAELEGKLVGFVTVIAHPATWSTKGTGYLEDLFVRADCRGLGIGHALIDAVLDRARASGWGSVYWHARADNHQARLLYDRFARADDFVRYRILLG